MRTTGSQSRSGECQEAERVCRVPAESASHTVLLGVGGVAAVAERSELAYAGNAGRAAVPGGSPEFDRTRAFGQWAKALSTLMTSTACGGLP